jgi:NTE family protein
MDVQEGVTVVFDSYTKEDGSRKTEYGNYGPEFASRSSNENEGYEHVIKYDDGIQSDFILASRSVPVNYDYNELVVDNSSIRIIDQAYEKKPFQHCGSKHCRRN